MTFTQAFAVNDKHRVSNLSRVENAADNVYAPATRCNNARAWLLLSAASSVALVTYE